MDPLNKSFGPIIFKPKDIGINKQIQEAKELIKIAKYEADEIIKIANSKKDEIYKKSKEEGRVEGIKLGILEIISIPSIYQKLLKNLSEDIVKLIKAVSEEIISREFLNQKDIFNQEIKKRVTNLLIKLEEENIINNNIIKIKVPYGQTTNINKLDNIKNIEIVESEECGQQDIIIETKYGNISSIPMEHLNSLINNLSEKIPRNKGIKNILKSTLKEYFSYES